MSGNFDYVTYRPLNVDVREDVGPEVADDDDDALLDVDATDVLNSRDLTLRMDTEDESDHGECILGSYVMTHEKKKQIGVTGRACFRCP